MTAKLKLPVKIRFPSYLSDHRHRGKIVLPAVEAMGYLATFAGQHFSPFHGNCLAGAKFDKFLFVPDDNSPVEALCELETVEGGILRASLMTKTTALKSGITRTREHAAVDFVADPMEIPELPLDIASTLEGICFEIPSERLYDELVPFGPAYQNVNGTLYVTEGGAIARISGGPGQGETGPLGSPFPLDAAFHAACAWGQRYSGFVPFPVGLQTRVVRHPTRFGEEYYGRIVPRGGDGQTLLFDILVYDDQGELREACLGVRMKDVSGGKAIPPGWVRTDDCSLDTLKSQCAAHSVVELRTIASFASKALSIPELDRMVGMGDRRKRAYIATRLCLKLLARKLSGDVDTNPAKLTTFRSDRIRPSCPLPEGSEHYACSASQDKRFAVAVASRQRVGVDVERISERVLKLEEIFLDDSERGLIRRSRIDGLEGAVRVWTIKEAAAKAFGFDLPSAWKKVRVAEFYSGRSKVEVEGVVMNSYHDIVEGHMFTLLTAGETRSHKPAETYHDTL